MCYRGTYTPLLELGTKVVCVCVTHIKRTWIEFDPGCMKEYVPDYTVKFPLINKKKKV